MKFDTYEERLRHPQAGIIPEHVWSSSEWDDRGNKDYRSESLKSEFPDELVSLVKRIQEKPKSLLSYIKFKRPTLKKFNKKVVFIIALSYSNLKLKSIRKIMGLLNISEDCFFGLCAKVGNVELIKVLRNMHPERWIQERISSNDYEALRETISRGYLKAFTYLAKHVPDLQGVIASSNYEMFRLAAFHGDTLVLSYLIAKLPEKLNTMIEADSYYAFRFAAANGHLEVLKYLSEKHARDIQSMIKAKDYYSFRKAAARGHLAVVQYLIKKVSNKPAMIAADQYYGFRIAAERGHESVVHLLLSDPQTFAYAEHKAEFEHYIFSYIAE